MLKAISELQQQQIKQEPPEPPPDESCPVPGLEEDLEEGEILGQTVLSVTPLSCSVICIVSLAHNGHTFFQDSISKIVNPIHLQMCACI